MITINHVSKVFANRTLFQEVSISVYRNEKIGLTGPNGAGKTTLFSIIRGEMEATAGDVQIQKNINIGYLPQEARFHSQRTVMDEIASGDDRILALKKEKQRLEERHQADTMRYGDILHELETLGIYELEHKAEKILSGLGFSEKDFQKPITTLSGGWQMRTLLAKLLTYPYDLLLLDEPTNYLDLNATLWLKDFLKGYAGAFVIISHDKVFLNDVTNYTIMLENGRIIKVKGNYAQYELLKKQEQLTLEKKQKVLEKKKAQLERFCERFHAQPNRAAAVRNKRKMIERMETVELDQHRSSIQEFEFSQTRRSGYNVIAMEKVEKSYNDKKIYENLNFEITSGQRICLVGENGAGKSTLLKMLAGVLDFEKGTRKLGHQVEVGYFSQTRLDVLNFERTVLEELCSAAETGVRSQEARTLLGLFNFRGDDVFKKVQVLSGGEKSRLILAKLLIRPPNFILLDEPTTHLDIDGVEALTKAFNNYEGTLCFISHDLFFVKEIANHIVEVSQGCLKHYYGGLDYYLEKRQRQQQEAVFHSKKIERETRQRKKIQKQHDNKIVDRLKAKHQQALRCLKANKMNIKALIHEKKDLDEEYYVKARIVSSPHHRRDGAVLKEYGRRLKWIQRRVREIEAEIQHIQLENQNIQK